jgi:Cu2+-exporting ATPase
MAVNWAVFGGELMTQDTRMTVATACYHCGFAVAGEPAYRALVDGQRHTVCCPGCQAVAEAIADSGLSSYYRTRTALAARAESPGPGEGAGLHIYDQPEVQAGFVRRLGDDERETTLIFEGITCAACVWLNEQHLSRLPGVLSVEINYATRRARVRWDECRIKLSEILAQAALIGYRAWPATTANAEEARKRETRAALWRLFVAGFGMMQVMMYALPAYLADAGSMGEDVRLLMRLASLVLTVPVVFYSAWPFFRGALRDFQRRRLGMDVPIALGIGAAFGASLLATFTGGAEVYYDSLTMFVFFLLCARYLEMRARQTAAARLDYLDKALPLAAHRLVDYGSSMDAEEVPAVSLRIGDRVLVRPGESFPADGIVVEGDSECDESLLTGESSPVRKTCGDEVTGGALNRLSPVVMRVTRVGEETRLSGIRRLVQNAAAQRPQVAEMADRLAGWFVAAVLLIAVVSAIAWLRVDPARALSVVVAVLVVSCPCALSLATPAAMTVAVGCLARRGVVAVRAHAIDALAGVTHVVFDKTGTLTEGRLGLAAVLPGPGVEAGEALALAAALERTSEHPIALALTVAASADSQSMALEVRNVPGAGIEGCVDGMRHRLGTALFVAEIAGPPVDFALPPAGATRVWLGRENQWLACFDLTDRVRPEAAAVVRRLRAQGKRVLIWSGDAAGAVEAVARQIGVEAYEANVLPQDKQARMQAMQRYGAVVAMVGDGVNDAPVLAQAQLAVAMGSGALLSQAQADLVLLSGRLQGLLDAFTLAAQTRRIVRQSLMWAAAYNLAALPLAALGMVTPWLAGLGMGLSSLAVVLNSLRVGRGPRRRDAKATRTPAEARADAAPTTSSA